MLLTIPNLRNMFLHHSKHWQQIQFRQGSKLNFDQHSLLHRPLHKSLQSKIPLKPAHKYLPAFHQNHYRLSMKIKLQVKKVYQVELYLGQ